MLQGKTQTPDIRSAGAAQSRFEKLGIEMGGLLQAAASLVPEQGRAAIVQVAGVEGGEGATTVATEFARATMDRLGRRVCLVSVTRAGAPAPEGEPGGGPFRALSIPAETFNAEIAGGLAGLLGGMAPEVDLFVIDSPPMNRSIAGFLIGRQVDGTILVVDAGRTLVDAAETACKAVAGGGGRLLGVVVNRRRYRVPRFLGEIFGLGVAPKGLPGQRLSWIWPAAAAIVLAILAAALIQRQAAEPPAPAVEETDADATAGG